MQKCTVPCKNVASRVCPDLFSYGGPTLSRTASNAGEDAMPEVKPRVNETLIHFEGDVAQQIGLPRAGNPYRHATLEQQAWWKGWDEAQERLIPSKSA